MYSYRENVFFFYAVVFKADWAAYQVKIQQLGPTASILRGSLTLDKDEEETLYHYSTFEFVPGSGTFRVEFDPPPSLKTRMFQEIFCP